MERFTLVVRHWYAAEFIGEEFGSDIRSISPIRIHGITPKKNNNRLMELDFYHANYPEGVRDKKYRLETLERNQEFYLARSIDHIPIRILLIFPITAEWLRVHFDMEFSNQEDIDDWLDRHL